MFVEHLTALLRGNQAIGYRERGWQVAPNIVQFAIGAAPPAEPSGLGVQEGFDIPFLQAICELGEMGGLFRAARAGFKVGHAPPGAVGERVDIGVLVAGRDAVPRGLAMRVRIAVATVLRLHNAVAIDVPALGEFADKLQPFDVAVQPVGVAGGLDIGPCPDQDGGVSIHRGSGIIDIAHLAGGSDGIIHPKLDRASQQGGCGNPGRELGHEEHMVGKLEDERAHGIAHDIVGPDAAGFRRIVDVMREVPVRPIRADLEEIQPSAPRGIPLAGIRHRLRLREIPWFEIQNNLLARLWDRQFERDGGRAEFPPAFPTSLQGRGLRARNAQRAEVGRIDERRQNDLRLLRIVRVIRPPAGERARGGGCGIEGQHQFQPLELGQPVSAASKVHRHRAVLHAHGPEDFGTPARQTEEHAIGSAFLRRACETDDLARRAADQRDRRAQQVQFCAIAALGVPTQEWQRAGFRIRCRAQDSVTRFAGIAKWEHAGGALRIGGRDKREVLGSTEAVDRLVRLGSLVGNLIDENLAPALIAQAIGTHEQPAITDGETNGHIFSHILRAGEFVERSHPIFRLALGIDPDHLAGLEQGDEDIAIPCYRAARLAARCEGVNDLFAMAINAVPIAQHPFAGRVVRGREIHAGQIVGLRRSDVLRRRWQSRQQAWRFRRTLPGIAADGLGPAECDIEPVLHPGEPAGLRVRLAGRHQSQIGAVVVVTADLPAAGLADENIPRGF